MVKKFSKLNSRKRYVKKHKTQKHMRYLKKPKKIRSKSYRKNKNKNKNKFTKKFRGGGEGIPDEIVCPLTLDVMIIPVKIRRDDNHAFDLDAIKMWFDKCRADSKPMTNPLTNVKTNGKLYLDRTILAAVIMWRMIKEKNIHDTVAIDLVNKLLNAKREQTGYGVELAIEMVTEARVEEVREWVEAEVRARVEAEVTNADNAVAAAEREVATNNMSRWAYNRNRAILLNEEAMERAAAEVAAEVEREAEARRTMFKLKRLTRGRRGRRQ